MNCPEEIYGAPPDLLKAEFFEFKPLRANKHHFPSILQQATAHSELME
jgi:hypothetical protein